jgi:predicted ATPase
MEVRRKMTGLDGFGFSSYRSFGEKIQLVGPLQKINLVIGQNNSGKSNILQFAYHHLHGVASAARDGAFYSGFKPIDNNIGRPAHVKFAIGQSLGTAHIRWRAYFEKSQRLGIMAILEKLLRSSSLTSDGEVAWFIYEMSQNSKFKISQDLVRNVAHELNQGEWSTLWTSLTGQRSGDLIEHWVPETLHKISPVQEPLPPVIFVPAIRAVQDKSGDATDFSGAGLIKKLAHLQQPGYSEQHLKNIFEKINIFLRKVTGSASAYIDIPAAGNTINVYLNGRMLPLESLGTGVHEVVILAAAATVVSEHLVCIEEPEIHLHPLLQRKLIEHLQEATDNQYLIATHSGHILDEKGVNIFHVKLREEHSTVRRAVESPEKFNVCFDLGYRSSDLLQSNCVIWVEGPSDRTYIRHWLRQVAPQFVEGTHFSLMFYGGRLLSHLTAEDPEVTDFISLRRLNRFISIVIDSDRAKPRQRLNATKVRVRSEFEKGPGFAWITAGREIENYIPGKVLEQAIREVHGNVRDVPDPGQFGNTLVYVNIKGTRKEADKVKVACKVTQESKIPKSLDLRQQLEKLVRFIGEANGA